MNRERKKLRSNHFFIKVENLKNAKPSAWWKELKNLSGMQIPMQSENLIAQLHIDNINKENVLDIANRINSAFVEPMHKYQPLQINPFTDTLVGHDTNNSQTLQNYQHTTSSKHLMTGPESLWP